MAHRSLVLSVVCSLAVLPAAFGQHPNLEKGFSAEKAYAVGQIDDVNLFNGNMVVTIPIGQQYPLSSTFSYGLRAVHNGKVWDYIANLRNVAGQGFPVDMEEEMESLADPNANAGFGWRLSLGRIVQSYQSPFVVGTPGGSYAYESSDGALHTFYPKLHEDDPRTDAGILYTRDGSYLRMHCSGPCMTAPGGSATVDSPDGTVRTFVFDTITTDTITTKEWRLTQINDGNPGPTNWVKIGYFPTSALCPPATTLAWAITDSQQRSHTVCFADMAIDGTKTKTVTDVFLKSFGGADAHYQFEYADQTYDRESAFIAGGDTLASPTLTAASLMAIHLPGGMSYSFRYVTAGTLPTPGSEPMRPSGNIQRVVLPTGGRYDYTYGGYLLPTNRDCTTPVEFIEQSQGLIQKHQYDASNADLGAWTYQTFTPTSGHMHACSIPAPPQFPFRHPLVFFQLDPVEWVSNTVIPPDNKSKTIHYFSAWPGLPASDGDSVNGFKEPEYGLPFTRDAAKALDGLFLSSEMYACDDARGNIGCSATPVQSTYVGYDQDLTPFVATLDSKLNSRLRASRTVFWLGGEHYNQSSDSDYDGLGHYRVHEVTGFDVLDPPGTGVPKRFGNVLRRTTAAYNRMDPDVDPFGLPNVGKYPGGFNQLLPSDPWQLGMYSSQLVEELGSPTTKSLFCFDRVTGFLKMSRVGVPPPSPLPPPGVPVPATPDLVQRFTADSSGNVVRKEMFGGDPPSNFSGPLCSLTPDKPTYRIDQTYASGVLATSQYFDVTKGAPVPFLSTDNDIDPSTGLVRGSRDSARILTTYAYDSLGRLRSVTPPAPSAPTTYSYTNPSFTPPGDSSATTPFVPAQIDVTRASSTTGSTHQQMQFDSFGRKILESKLTADGAFTSQKTTYDVEGRTASVSEWETAPSHYTLFKDFDVFDRPTTITAPDNSVTTLTYDGMRSTSRKVIVNAGLSATTQEFHDSRGRLTQVIEPNNNSVTTYTYDVGDRLTNVTMVGDGVAQPRTFAYDYRGFLLSEKHPESGTTFYNGYDAAGHSLHKQTPTADLTFVYDAAERLTNVADGGIPLKEFAYSDVAGSPSLGKLDHSVRHNYHTGPIGDIPVTEAFAYGGPGGRVSEKKTTVSGLSPSGFPTVLQTYTTDFQYDDLDSLNITTYPVCDGCSTTVPPRSVTGKFQNGFLREVVNYTSSTTPMTYWPNGLYKTITHRRGDGIDGPTLSQDIDAGNGMARPASITVTGAIEQTCPTVAITALPSILAGASGTATASVTPLPQGATYTWSATNATITPPPAPGSSTIAFTAGCSGSVQLSLTVSDACGAPVNSTVSIAVTQPTLTVTGAPATIAPGTTARLTAAYSGSVPWSITWDGVTQVVSTGSTTRDVTPGRTTSYTATATASTCPTPVSATTTVTVVPLAPSNVQASLSASGAAINLSWSPTPGADSYVVQRSFNGGGYGDYATSFTAQYTDNDPLIAARGIVTYLYRVVAVAAGTRSNPSASDLATRILFTDDPVVSGFTLIRGVQVDEARQAVDAVRASVGLGRIWSGVVSIAGQQILASHFGEVTPTSPPRDLLHALNEARALLGLPPISFGALPTPAPGVAIVGQYLTTIRNGVK